MPIRVLHVVINMNRGGAETLIMNLYNHMDHSKVQFDFLTCKEGVFDTEVAELGGRVHRIPYVSDVGHFGYLKALERFFDSHKDYKIVHSHLDRMSGFVLGAAKKAGISVRIAHSHSTKSEGGLAKRLYKWYGSSFIPSSATHLMACSDVASKWLFGNNQKQCLIIKNGIDVDKFAFSGSVRSKVREELGINEKTIVLGHVGSFSHPKNHSFLIEVFSEFVKHNPRAVLLLVGDGPLRQSIENKVKSLGLQDNVRFLGMCSDIHNLIQAFDLFVFPSLYEGLPVTLIEAQAAGISCIISDAISREVDMGVGLIEYLPVIDKLKWVDRLKKSTVRSSSKNTNEALKEKGYDIRAISQSVQDFYLNVSR